MNSLIYDTILLNRVSSHEKKFLLNFLEYKEIQTQEWILGSKMNGSENQNIIYFSEEFSPVLLNEFKDWSRIPLVFGRFQDEEVRISIQNESILFFDLKNHTIEDMPIFSFMSSKNNQAIICSKDKIFSKFIKLILKEIGISSTILEAEISIFQKFKQVNPNLLIIDWDSFSLQETLDSLTQLESGMIATTIFNVLNLNNFEIFQILSKGIKNFSSKLFSKKEIIQLLFQSLSYPLPEAKLEEKVFQWNLIMNGKINSVDILNKKFIKPENFFRLNYSFKIKKIFETFVQFYI